MLPENYLDCVEISDQGNSKFLVDDVGHGTPQEFQILACAWVDRSRRFFVSTAGSLTPVALQERIRWRKDEKDRPYQ